MWALIYAPALRNGHSVDQQSEFAAIPAVAKFCRTWLPAPSACGLTPGQSLATRRLDKSHDRTAFDYLLAPGCLRDAARRQVAALPSKLWTS